MPNATFEARAVYPPEPQGRKSYKVLGSDGETYFVKSADGAGLKQGDTYEAYFEENDFKGKTLRMVQTIKPSNTTNGAAQKVMEKAAYPGVATGVGDRDKNRHIFVCGAINSALRLKLGPEPESGWEITDVWSVFGSRDKIRASIDNLVRAYDTSLLANPQKSEDMDDEIPM